VLVAEPEVNIDEPPLPLDVPTPRPADEYDAGGVVYMTKPLDRPDGIPGKTYKIKWPENDHAFYITLNDLVQDGRRRPFEIFINSKNMEHYAWTVALTRMISAVFRRGGDVSFVVEELKAVFDPRGGQWVKGRYVPSILAAIGEVIEQHLIDIGFITDAGNPLQVEEAKKVVGDAAPVPGMRACPKCSAPTLIRQEGCDSCVSCGYSKCG
jgi:ribonucleoside-diphosphate reductase alpha chain